MILVNCDINRVENGFIVNTHYDMTEAEYKEAVAKVKEEGDCYCVDKRTHTSYVFTSFDEVVEFLAKHWKV